MTAPDRHPSGPGRTAVALFGLVASIYLLTASGHLYLADAWSSLSTAESIVTRGALDIPFEPSLGGKFAPDGRFYSKYGPGIAVHMLGPAAAGHLLRKLVASAPAKKVAMGLPASLVNVPFAALTAVVVFLIGRRLGYRTGTCLATTLALAFGTMLWPYSKYDASEPQVALALIVSLYLLLGASPLLAGVALGWAVLVKPTALLALPAFACAIWIGDDAMRLRRLRNFLVGPGCAGLASLGYNWLRFGNPLDTGYSAEVQTYTIPFLVGLYGLLLSAGKGLFFFSPALIFSLPGLGRFHRKHPAVALSVGWMFLFHLCFYSFQQNWDGDWSWGPRYLLPCVPFLMLFALELFDAPLAGWRKALVGAVAAIAVSVQLLGVLVNPTDYVRWVSENKTLLGDFLKEPDKTYIPLHPHHFNPDLSPIRGHWHLLMATFDRTLGRPPSPMLLYSSIEERSDATGHRLTPAQALPTFANGTGIDLWLPLYAGMTRGRPGLNVLVWIAFAVNAVLVVRSRRALARAIRHEALSPPAG